MSKLTEVMREPRLLHPERGRCMPIGHRGAPKDYPENTLESFQRALEAGVWMVELDVRQSSDGVLFVFHDDKLDRLCGSEGSIEDSTSKALAKLKVEGWFKIPKLSEVLVQLREKVWVNVEVKTGDPAKVAAALKEGGMADQAIVSSFDWKIIAGMNQASPEIARGLISEEAIAPDAAAAALDEHSAVGWFPRHDRVDGQLVEVLHAAGVSVVPWTVDDEPEMRRLLKLGVDGLISNDVTTVVRATS